MRRPFVGTDPIASWILKGRHKLLIVERESHVSVSASASAAPWSWSWWGMTVTNVPLNAQIFPMIRQNGYRLQGLIESHLVFVCLIVFGTKTVPYGRHTVQQYMHIQHTNYSQKLIVVLVLVYSDSLPPPPTPSDPTKNVNRRHHFFESLILIILHHHHTTPLVSPPPITRQPHYRIESNRIQMGYRWLLVLL